MESTQTHVLSGAAAPDDLVHSGIACLAMLLRFHHLAADPRQIAGEHAPDQRDLDLLTLVRAARQLGLKARSVKVKAKRLERTPLPAIAQFNDDGYAILAKVSGAKALLQRPGLAPQEMCIGDLLEKWTGFLMFATTAETLAGARRKFDITWFIPVIAKYRKLLGGLRTYLFSHTTSRVDVELGARLFEHPLALPVNHFESRQTGQTVARVHELENIRDFITGSALTLIIIDRRLSTVMIRATNR